MTNRKFQFFHKPELRDQAHELYRRGGLFRKAGEKIIAIIGLITAGESNPLSDLKMTKHGETRLDKCIKYDLPGACRLVTVQDKGVIILLFSGDHESEEKWLKTNRGKKFYVDKDSRLDEIKVISSSLADNEVPELLNSYSEGPLFELLPSSVYDDLVESLPRSISRDLEKLHCFSSDDEILKPISAVKDQEQQDLLMDVFVLLKENSVEEALRRIALNKGEFEEIPDLPVLDSERIYSIPDNDPTYAELFSHFVKTADYKKWMLFMHPEQQDIVDQDFKGSAKLLGVSGSGKTCVVVKRAIRLAGKYPNERILIVTLNRSLARLIKELVESTATDAEKGRIDVKPFFSVCQEYLTELEPGNDKLYDDTTWKSREHIDEVWSEYYRCELNNADASVLHSVHDYFIAQGVLAESYIREEFDWIRSAVEVSNRSIYLSIDREGRSVPLQERYRKELLQGLEYWERKMRTVGVTDYLGLATALNKHKGSLKKRYRCVLVDESQDFGTTELSIIREIVPENENDIFICGDAAQRVSTKFQSLSAAGINIAGTRSKRLYKNYRNSREILRAAHKVLVNNLTENIVDSEDFEVLDPKFSSFSGSAPLILKADTLEQELAFAIAYAKEQIASNPNWKICVAMCGYSLYELKYFSDTYGFLVLDGDASLGADSIFISDLEQTKGFEFDIMIVVNASRAVFPNPLLPRDEHFRELCHFYVALTRAKSELIVSYHGEPSVVLSNTDDVFLSENWSSYIHDLDIMYFDPPKNINVMRNNGVYEEEVLFMDAQSFLHTKSAIGLPGALISKLRELVDGSPLNRQGHLVKWRNMGSAYNSITNSTRSRLVFGSERIKEFQDLCERLEFPRLIKKLVLII